MEHIIEIVYSKIMITDTKEMKKKFGEKIREYRKIANLTQEQLAEKCGCSWQTISGAETGYSFPSSKILFKLSTALNMPLVYFFNFDNTNLVSNEEEAKLVNIFKKLSKEKQELVLKMILPLISEN